MPTWNFQNLYPFQGKVVRLTSTEGEIMIAEVTFVDEEHEDISLGIKSTNQPERYERLGGRFDKGGWVMPFEFIADVSLAPPIGTEPPDGA